MSSQGWRGELGRQGSGISSWLSCWGVLWGPPRWAAIRRTEQPRGAFPGLGRGAGLILGSEAATPIGQQGRNVQGRTSPAPDLATLASALGALPTGKDDRAGAVATWRLWLRGRTHCAHPDQPPRLPRAGSPPTAQPLASPRQPVLRQVAGPAAQMSCEVFWRGGRRRHSRVHEQTRCLLPRLGQEEMILCWAPRGLEGHG